MATSQVPTSNSVTTRALLVRRFELMAAEHVARMGARMAQRRKELKLTQREVADLIPGKADSNQVSKWERGEHKASDDTLEHIAKALQVDVSYFHVPEPKAGTPDLMGTIRAGESQLDRVEAKLDRLLAILEQPGDIAGPFVESIVNELESRGVGDQPAADPPGGGSKQRSDAKPAAPRARARGTRKA